MPSVLQSNRVSHYHKWWLTILLYLKNTHSPTIKSAYRRFWQRHAFLLSRFQTNESLLSEKAVRDGLVNMIVGYLEQV